MKTFRLILGIINTEGVTVQFVEVESQIRWIGATASELQFCNQSFHSPLFAVLEIPLSGGRACGDTTSHIENIGLSLQHIAEHGSFFWGLGWLYKNSKDQANYHFLF